MASVLIVDDDETLRELVCDLLSEGHRCQTAATTEEALAHLTSETYDVVVTDVLMPGRNGLELLKYVKRNWPETPVIIVSVLNDEESVRRFVELGAFDHVVKPFHLEALEASVASAIEHRQEMLEERQKEGNNHF